jgi:hypothetical protein
MIFEISVLRFVVSVSVMRTPSDPRQRETAADLHSSDPLHSTTTGCAAVKWETIARAGHLAALSAAWRPARADWPGPRRDGTTDT